MDYFAYNLVIRSLLPLPDLFPAATKAFNRPDVVLRAERIVSLPEAVRQEGSFIRIARDQSLLFSKNVGAFELRQGREVLIETANNVSEGSLHACVSGAVLAVVLYQRGFLILHASAVAVQDRCGDWSGIGFLGDSGEGKSTMAATLHARGHQLVADDFIAVSLLDGQTKSATEPDKASDSCAPMVSPGFPQMNLWPMSLQALGETSLWPLLHPTETKRARRVSERFATTDLPLRRLFVLETAGDTGADINCHPLSPAQGLAQMVRHSYCAGFLAPGEMARQFDQLGSLARCVSVYRLERPRDLGRLTEVAKMVEGEIQAG